MKWGPGDWSIILHHFAEYLKFMLTMDPCLYIETNTDLVLDFKMWERFELNLPVWCCTLRKYSKTPS